MEHTITHQPSYALLTVDLEAGERLVAEAGAMVSHTEGIDIETGARGGLLGSLKRKALGGESFFMNTFTADRDAHVKLAPALPGDVVAQDVADETLYVQSGSFMATEPDVDVDTKFGGGRSFFAEEGLFLLALSGTGRTFLSSYGAIDRIDLASDEAYVVDTGHVVAFEETTSWNVKRVGGLKSTLFSGEGFVCEFAGPGSVWLQSRSADALLSWLTPRVASQAGNGSGGIEFDW
ncbi:MAG: TIGR00266 family protein [Haloarculaceae archaeon]